MVQVEAALPVFRVAPMRSAVLAVTVKASTLAQVVQLVALIDRVSQVASSTRSVVATSSVSPPPPCTRVPGSTSTRAHTCGASTASQRQPCATARWLVLGVMKATVPRPPLRVVPAPPVPALPPATRVPPTRSKVLASLRTAMRPPAPPPPAPY